MVKKIIYFPKYEKTFLEFAATDEIRSRGCCIYCGANAVGAFRLDLLLVNPKPLSIPNIERKIMSEQSNVTDLPLAPNLQDQLGLSNDMMALCSFVKTAQTPMIN